MARVKRGVTKRARHKKILKSTEGYRGAKRRLVRVAKEAMLHAGEYAFAGRKLRKRDFRSLWIIRINAALRNSHTKLSYSQFINKLKEKRVEIDRKILADLATSDQNTFNKIVKKVMTPASTTT